jgi:protein phosphatase
VRLRAAARSEVGLVREHNEDSALVGTRLLLVADGMGGHAAGEVASAAAVDALAVLDSASLPSDSPQLQDALDAAVAAAGARMRALVTEDPRRAGMGTTVTAVLLLDDHHVGVLQIGDSRAYLMHEADLQRLTRDQTYVQALLDEGSITDDEARIHPQRNVMLQALDGRTDVVGVLTVTAVAPGDRLLVCSDGLSGVVEETELRDGLFSPDPQTAVDRLVEAALRAGAPDNVTVIVADLVEDAGGADPAPAPPGPARLGAADAAGTAPPPTGPDAAVPAGPSPPGAPDGPDAGTPSAASGASGGRGRGAHRTERRRWWRPGHGAT